jgi:hypothetical protein
VGLILVTAAVLAALAEVPPVAASGKKAAPPRGWVVDRARFESLDPAHGSLSVSGKGEVRGAIRWCRGRAVWPS